MNESICYLAAFLLIEAQSHISSLRHDIQLASFTCPNARQRRGYAPIPDELCYPWLHFVLIQFESSPYHLVTRDTECAHQSRVQRSQPVGRQRIRISRSTRNPNPSSASHLSRRRTALHFHRVFADRPRETKLLSGGSSTFQSFRRQRARQDP
jgi:hypothetical protein